MKILVLGGNGYLGWPQAMYLSVRGHDVHVVDNFLRRRFDLDHGLGSLTPIASLHQRVARWQAETGHAWDTFPVQATRHCLQTAGITWRDLDAGKTMGLAPYGASADSTVLPFGDLIGDGTWKSKPPFDLPATAHYTEFTEAWMSYLTGRFGLVTHLGRTTRWRPGGGTAGG